MPPLSSIILNRLQLTFPDRIEIGTVRFSRSLTQLSAESSKHYETLSLGVCRRKSGRGGGKGGRESAAEVSGVLARLSSLLFERRRERVFSVKSCEKIKLAAAHSGNELDSSVPPRLRSGDDFRRFFSLSLVRVCGRTVSVSASSLTRASRWRVLRRSVKLQNSRSIPSVTRIVARRVAEKK